MLVYWIKENPNIIVINTNNITIHPPHPFKQNKSVIKYIRHPTEYFKGPATHTFILCSMYLKGEKGKNKTKKNEENDLLKTEKTKTYQKSN